MVDPGALDGGADATSGVRAQLIWRWPDAGPPEGGRIEGRRHLHHRRVSISAEVVPHAENRPRSLCDLREPPETVGVAAGGAGVGVGGLGDLGAVSLDGSGLGEAQSCGSPCAKARPDPASSNTLARQSCVDRHCAKSYSADTQPIAMLTSRRLMIADAVTTEDACTMGRLGPALALRNIDGE